MSASNITGSVVPGPAGPTGPAGPAGATGAAGAAGANGSNGIAGPGVVRFDSTQATDVTLGRYQTFATALAEVLAQGGGTIELWSNYTNNDVHDLQQRVRVVGRFNATDDPPTVNWSTDGVWQNAVYIENIVVGGGSLTTPALPIDGHTLWLHNVNAGFYAGATLVNSVGSSDFVVLSGGTNIGAGTGVGTIDLNIYGVLHFYDRVTIASNAVNASSNVSMVGYGSAQNVSFTQLASVSYSNQGAVEISKIVTFTTTNPTLELRDAGALIRADTTTAGGSISISLPSFPNGTVIHVQKIGTAGNVTLGSTGVVTTIFRESEIASFIYYSGALYSLAVSGRGVLFKTYHVSSGAVADYGTYSNIPDAVTALRTLSSGLGGVLEVTDSVFVGTAIDLEGIDLIGTLPGTGLTWSGVVTNPRSFTNIAAQQAGPGGYIQYTQSMTTRITNSSFTDAAFGAHIQLNAGVTVTLILENNSILQGGSTLITVPATSTLNIDLYGSTLENSAISGAGNVNIRYRSPGPNLGQTQGSVSGTLTVTYHASYLTLTDQSIPLAPLVQSTHTAVTKTIAATDIGQHIPLSAAANAIAVTVPHTLFGAIGTGRAFRWTHEVLSVAGGAVTFAGSGGIVIEYSGKDPGVTPYAAGDFLEVIVTSATKARVHCREQL
jgi:hypothetical protein